MKLSVVCLVMVLGLAALPLRAAEKIEPKFKGKPLAYWVERLQKAETDPEMYAAAEAIEAFSADAAPAVAALVDMLDDRSEVFRGLVSRILYKLGPAGKSAVPSLTRMLKDKTARSPEDVISVLGAIGPDAKEAVPVLIEAVADPELSIIAVRDLGNIGPAAAEAVPALMQVMKNTECWVEHWGAMKALGKIGPAAAKAVPVLIDILPEVEHDLGRHAADALGMIGPAAKTAAPPLRQAMKDGSPIMRTAAARALWRIERDPSVIPVLIQVLEVAAVDDPDVREVVHALGEVGPVAKHAVPLLKKQLTHRDRSVREAAVAAIRKTDPIEGRKLRLSPYDGTVEGYSVPGMYSGPPPSQ